MKYTPPPWHPCHGGKCKCMMISSDDHPIAQVISGEWGDEYVDIRLVEREGGIGRVAEAYIERMVYGEVDPEYAEGNARIIGAAAELYEKLRDVRADLEMLLEDGGLEYYDFSGIDAVLAKVERGE